MNMLKKYLGVIWMLTGPIIIIFMIQQAFEKVTASNAKAAAISDTIKRAAAFGEVHNTILQWSIIILIFIPIAIGFVIFGKYSFAGEYDHVPQTSDEL